MAYAKTNYVGDGVEVNYSVGFPYVEKSHVTVYLDNVETTAFTWLSDTVITMDVAPADQVDIAIIRFTQRSARLVDYTDTSIMNEEVLDKDSNQLFYVMQESFDENESVMKEDSAGDLDAINRKIVNVADGVADTDAVNKAQVAAITAADAAAAAASAAEAQALVDSVDNIQDQVDACEASEIAAEASAVEAAASAASIDPDFLKARANHTGTQPISTLSDHDKAAHDSLSIDAATAVDSDTVDSIHASAAAEANKLIAVGSDKVFPKDVHTKHRGCLAVMSPAQSIPNTTFTTLEFAGADIEDTDSIHDPATNNTRLVVPSGVTRVRLTAHVAWGALTGGYRWLDLQKNGGGIAPSCDTLIEASSIGTTKQLLHSPIYTVTGGDYFEVRGYHNQGTSVLLGVSDSETWFEMEIIE